MGSKLTFENYRPGPGEFAPLDPKWQDKYGYRDRTFTLPVILTAEEQRFNTQEQEKRAKYADGLHGYDYYSMAGNGDTEFKALSKRFKNSIPVERWVVEDSIGVKSAYQDREDTFKRLEALQPPPFMNAGVPASARKIYSKESNKILKKQLKDYKEMRANWEESEKGQKWRKEVQRLKDMEEGRLVPSEEQKLQISRPTQAKNVSGIDGVKMDVTQAGLVNMGLDLVKYAQDESVIGSGIPYRQEIPASGVQKLTAKYNGAEYKMRPGGNTSFGSDLQNSDGTFKLSGTVGTRLLVNLARSLGQGNDIRAIEKLMDDLMAPNRVDVGQPGKETVKDADARFVKGVKALKGIVYGHLKRLEASYGILPTQLNADDFMRMAPEEVLDHFAFLQDAAILMQDAAALFDFAHNDQDKEFKKLWDYYFHSWMAIKGFMQANMLDSQTKAAGGAGTDPAALAFINGIQGQRGALAERKEAADLSPDIGGPRLEGYDLHSYNEIVGRRYSGGQKTWKDGMSLFLYN